MKVRQIIENKKSEAPKPRNFVAKNAMKTTSGAGAHKDKKKAAKQGYEKHKAKVEEGALDRMRDKLGSQGYMDTQDDRIQDRERRRQDQEDRAELWRREREQMSQRHQDRSNAALDSEINWERNRQKRDDARTQHEIDLLAQRLKRMDRNDDDWERTFDMMRDRINRYQYSTQRDVDPEQLAGITNIKYEPRKKKSDVDEGGAIMPLKNKNGLGQGEWVEKVKAKYPDAQFIGAKMPNGNIIAMLPDGREIVWKAVIPGTDNPIPRSMKSMKETATAGSTSAGNIAVGAVYKNKPGKTAKNKDGTAKNALDLKGANLITGGSLVKR